MKYINFSLEVYNSRPRIVIFGDQEELYDKYVADSSDENRELFLSSVDEELAFGIGFAVRNFSEDKGDDD